MPRLIRGLLLPVGLLVLLGQLGTAHAVHIVSHRGSINVPPAGPPKGPVDLPPLEPPSENKENKRVTRVQLDVAVCDFDGAGTDDTVVASLNDSNYTTLNAPGDDFKRGWNTTYDLLLTNVTRLGDIRYLKIQKGGKDSLCIETVKLYVNNPPSNYRPPAAPIYEKTWSALPGQLSGNWLDENFLGYDSRTLLILRSTLRGHSGWLAWQGGFYLPYMETEEIGDRLITAAATGMYDYNANRDRHSLRWTAEGITATKRDDTAIDVRVPLNYKHHGCNNPWACLEDGSTVRVTIRFGCTNGEMIVSKEWEGGATLDGDYLPAWISPRILEAFRNLTPRNLRFPSCPTIRVIGLSEAQIELFQ